jgi:hypothetical protein
MKSNRFLIIICLILLIGNISLGVMLFGRRPGHDHRPEGPKKYIIEKLHLDQAQQEKYETLITAHRAAISDAQDEIMKTKNKLYALLNQNDNTAKDLLVSQIALLQNKIENIHYDHFADIRALCRPDQLDEFNELSTGIAALFAPPPMKRK